MQAAEEERTVAPLVAPVEIAREERREGATRTAQSQGHRHVMAIRDLLLFLLRLLRRRAILLVASYHPTAAAASFWSSAVASREAPHEHFEERQPFHVG